jgi:trimeric autotransporter adhesin
MKTAMRFFTIFLFSTLHYGLIAQNMGIKLPASTLPNTTLDVNGAVSYREGTPLVVSNGINNNVVLDSMSFYRITAPTANFTITGLTNGQNGRVLILVNATSFTMTLGHLTGTSTAANQIKTASSADLIVASNGIVNLMYNTNLTKWIVVGVMGSNASAYNAWDVKGNKGTTAGTNFFGTTDVQDVVFKANDTEGVRLKTDGKVGIGTPNPTTRLTVTNNATIATTPTDAIAQFTNPNDMDTEVLIDTYGNNINDDPALVFRRARGNSVTPTALLNDDPMGRLSWWGHNGTNFVDQAAKLEVRANENWTATANGTKMGFITTPNGTTTLTQHMVLSDVGYLGIGLGTANPTQQLEITQAFRFPTTTSSITGVIYKDANRFIHNYKPAANDGNNTFVGVNAGNFTMSSPTSWLASGNTGIGVNALKSLTTAGYNTAVGFNALTANTTGNYNMAFGSMALSTNIAGEGNIAIGHGSLEKNTASSNTAIGNSALNLNTVGTGHVAIGESTLQKNTIGNYNTSVGQSSMRENIDGSSNTALGLSALQLNTSGSFNVALGTTALTTNVLGNNNTAVGYDALSITTSSNNVALGYAAGTGTSSGGNNVFVGYNAGLTNITGSSNTLLGYQANVATNNLSNATAIGNGASVNASNKVMIGNTAVTSIGGQVGWTTFSDGRFKSNLKENVPGISFITALRPVTYTLEIEKINEFLGQKIDDKEREELKEHEQTRQTGFIAQEVEEAAKKLDYDFSGVKKPSNERDNYALTYSDFVVPLVKAVQEQQAQIEVLTKENEELKVKVKEIDALKADIILIKKKLGF